MNQLHIEHNTPPYKNTAFLMALMQAENDQKVGYDPQNGWFPHESVEGGTPTLGYGHKLTMAEHAGSYVKVHGVNVSFSVHGRRGITDPDVVTLLRQDVERSWAKARSDWNLFYFNEISFDALPMKYQCVLTDLVYNIGHLAAADRFQWPKLANAIMTRDDASVRQESLRYYTPAGETKPKPLTERTTLICNAVGIGAAGAEFNL